MSREYGTYKKVRARLWPWLSGEGPSSLQVTPGVAAGRVQGLARKVPLYGYSERGSPVRSAAAGRVKRLAREITLHR